MSGTSGKKIGRPSFKPTPALRKKVSVRAAAGVSHEHIALALGIDEKTLRKHFAHELTLGAQERRQEMIDAMFRTGCRGNVSAQKAYVALCDKAQETFIPPPDQEPKAPPKGKKQQAEEAAQTAHVGTDWAGLLKPNATPQ